MSESIVDRLFEIVQDRRRQMPEGSYTAYLFREGENEIYKKVGEEAVEAVVAASREDDARVIYESADLIYHLLVMLEQRGLSWRAVEEELERRFA